MKLVVTGTGRSGTGYMAAVLNAAGVRCGHEAVHRPDTMLPGGQLEWGTYEADASWLAMPSLAWRRVERGVHAVLVVRHPVAVIKSYLSSGVFDRWDDYLATIQWATPATIAEPTTLDRAVAHWCAWNMLAAMHAEEIVRLEDVDAETFTPWLQALDHDLAELPAALTTTPRTVNRGPRFRLPLELDRVRAPLLRQLEHLAGDFGYRLEDT